MNRDRIRNAERVAAKAYEADGYAVIVGPSPEMIPFPLNDLRPDLLASKQDENVLVALKMPGGPVERYLRAAADVNQHPGWHLAIANVQDEDLTELPSDGRDGNPDEIRARLRTLDRLLFDADLAPFALPALWMAHVSALQLIMRDVEPKACKYDDASLLNAGYYMGITPHADYLEAERLLKLRNDVVRRFHHSATKADCLLLIEMTSELLGQYEAIER